MIQATPYCSSEPIGSEMNASASRAAETAPIEVSIQLPLSMPTLIVSMSSAI
jgi:hypothetical protein